MKIDKEKLRTSIHENNELVDILMKLGRARIVGGCIRDFALFGRFTDDVDIATQLLPDEVEQILAPSYKILDVGRKFGTVIAIGRQKYEITTLRIDAQTDGRHAVVEFCDSWELDSHRRDFTINALYADIDGNVYDYNDGFSDLANSRIRFILSPSERICEDYLRIMRFFRFVARFGEYDQVSLDACVQLCYNLRRISKERITQEWLKLVEGKFFWQNVHKFAPILDAIGMRTEVRQVDGISRLAMTYLFATESAMLVLSNEQKKYIALLRNVLNTKYDAIFYALRYGFQLTDDMMKIQRKIFEIDYIKNWPAFPISGGDIMKLGYSGKQIGECIDKLYKKWIASDASLSQEQLLAELDRAE